MHWSTAVTSNGIPDHNQMTERAHRTIKDAPLERIQRPMPTFLKKLQDMVKQLSVDRKVYNVTPAFSRRDWEKAIQLQRDPRMSSVLEMSGRYKGVWIFPSDTAWKKAGGNPENLGELKELYVKWFVKGQDREYPPTSLDQLIEVRSSFYHLQKIPRQADRPDVDICFHCSCPPYCHYSRCKHTFCLGLHLGLVSKPTSIDCDPRQITDKRGRGRPAKMSSCRKRQKMYLE